MSLGLPEDFVVHYAVFVSGCHQHLVREVGAEREIEDEVALGLAWEDTHVAELEGLEEDVIGELAAFFHAEHLLKVLVLEGAAVEVQVFLRAGAFLLQFVGDHLPDLVHEFGEEAKPVVHLVHGRFVEMVMRIDVQVEFQRLAAQFVFSCNVVIPAVVELDLAKVLARYQT